MDFNFLIAGAFGALLGAVLAIWRSRYSAKSTDLTKRIETIHAIIDALADSAARARTRLGAEQDGLLSSKSYCVALQGRLEDAIQRLHTDYGKFSGNKLSDAFIDFATACTGGAFDESEKESEPTIRFILISGGRLKDRVSEARMKHF